MERTASPFRSALWAVLAKDGLCELRSRYAFSTLLMFALVTLSSVSMTLASMTLSPEMGAALLWIILFFCAMAGLSRVFEQEQEAGTIFALRLYVPGQAVLFGKLLFNLGMLILLTILVVPLFVLFLNVDIPFDFSLPLILLAGNLGIAAASTLTAAIVAKTQGKSALFAVLTFPVLLPQFLAVISATVKVLSHGELLLGEWFFMIGYDVVLCIGASILFDYLWDD